MLKFYYEDYYQQIINIVKNSTRVNVDVCDIIIGYAYFVHYFLTESKTIYSIFLNDIREIMKSKYELSIGKIIHGTDRLWVLKGRWRPHTIEVFSNGRWKKIDIALECLQKERFSGHDNFYVNQDTIYIFSRNNLFVFVYDVDKEQWIPHQKLVLCTDILELFSHALIWKENIYFVICKESEETYIQYKFDTKKVEITEIGTLCEYDSRQEYLIFYTCVLDYIIYGIYTHEKAGFVKTYINLAADFFRGIQNNKNPQVWHPPGYIFYNEETRELVYQLYSEKIRVCSWDPCTGNIPNFQCEEHDHFVDLLDFKMNFKLENIF